MEPIRVGMGEYKVAASPRPLACMGLGSCVAVVLYDGARRIGGLAHVMLPGDASVGLLLQAMARRGAEAGRITARIFGGADMFPDLRGDRTLEIGERNVLAVREALDGAGIRIVAEEVGGHSGRTILFQTEDGSVRVREAAGREKVYPYGKNDSDRG